MVARIVWLGHATVLVELDGVRVLTDPMLRGRLAHLRRHGPVPALPAALDAVLISHLHRDHADAPTLRRVPADVPVIGPRGTAAALRHGAAHALEVGGRVDLTAGVAVQVVPARHQTRRNLLGATTDALGFLVEGSRRVYFAGDTDLFSGMAHIGAAGLDVALLPVWGWGTSLGPGHLDPDRAARAVALLRPRIAVPIHWGTYLPLGMGRRHRHLLRQPGRDFAAAVAREAPDVRTVVLAPGEALDLAVAQEPRHGRPSQV
jgi:L-ascorbate metabolism protein UlaG (beta-lactamase superfamily)